MQEPTEGFYAVAICMYAIGGQALNGVNVGEGSQVNEEIPDRHWNDKACISDSLSRAFLNNRFLSNILV